MRAAGAGSEFTVATLLLAGADHTLTDFTGRTAFDLARENRRNRVLEIFGNPGSVRRQDPGYPRYRVQTEDFHDFCELRELRELGKSSKTYGNINFQPKSFF